MRDTCEGHLSARDALAQQVASARPLRVILGAGRTSQPGWISTDRDTLDIARGESWRAVFGGRQADGMLAEHVWEHLSAEAAHLAATNCYRYLSSGARLRLAVPDGLHPDPAYIAWVRPGGKGRGAGDHRVLYNYETLAELLGAAGFRVELLEYWDRWGTLHSGDWQDDGGYIKRSLKRDRRNSGGQPNYTSIVVDAWKG